MEHLMLLENPRKKRRGRPRKSRSTLGGIRTLSRPLMGIKPVEVIAAVGGLAAATMVPALIIRSTAVPLTTTQKLLKVGLSFAVAVLIGGVAKNVVGSEAARAATFGGLAGAGAQTLGSFTTFKIGGNSGFSAPPVSRMGTADLVSPTRTRDGESVSVIQP